MAAQERTCPERRESKGVKSSWQAIHPRDRPVNFLYATQEITDHSPRESRRIVTDRGVIDKQRQLEHHHRRHDER